MRFAGCDLRCGWCDSPHTWKAARTCRIETQAGSGLFHEVDSPVPLETIEFALEALDLKRHRFLSLTGGEPLLQPRVVGALAGWARQRFVPVYLETHGLAVDALAEVVEWVDVVAMDWKLASDVRRESDRRGAPVREFHDDHERFLRTARRAGEVFVKVVLTPSTLEREIDEMCRRIAACAPDTPLILQPVTPFARVECAPQPEQLLAWLQRCEAKLSDVRLIPQTHKLVGVQ